MVALESTIISHGLPRPDNLRVAAEIEDAVRAGGAVPATVAVRRRRGARRAGRRRPGADRPGDDVVKVACATWPVAARGGHRRDDRRRDAHSAALAGIGVFATGGLGGVHRGARDTLDESADLTALARAGLVVCAGVKSILDVGATLERLETLGSRCSATARTGSPASTSATPATRSPGGWTRPPRSPP